MNGTLTAALRYHDRGMSPIPVMTRTKRPPAGFDLKRFFSERPSELDIRQWFRNGGNIGVLLGSVSDGLCVRDWDIQASYDDWATEHPRLADTLPTSQTARGAHVWFSADQSDVRAASRSGSATIILPDGELKSGDGYALAPCSVHPTGAVYRWLIEPDDVPYVSDLYASGLLPTNAQNRGLTQEIIQPFGVAFGGMTLDLAIELSQPTGYGQRHHCIFHLCRLLKSIPEYSKADAGDLADVFRRWFKLAWPRIKTKDFETSWRGFSNGWRLVRYPWGAKLSALADQAEGERIEKLKSLCRLLDADCGDWPFFLDCRAAGQVLGVSHVTAWKWLKQLCDAGTLERTRRGNHIKKLASEYRYVRDR